MESANRSVYRAQLTRLVNNAIDYLNSPSARAILRNAESFDLIEEELESYWQRIKNIQDNLNKVNIEMQASIKDEDLAKESESIAEYDDKATNALSRLTSRLSKIKSIANVNQREIADPQVNKSNVAKLPKLGLKTFSGGCKDWLPFWEQFRTAIHENPSLTTTDKFNYLYSSLTGKAAEVISGFTPTASCYDGAIALLLEEYGNKEKLIDKHLNELISTAPVNSRTDIDGIRRLYNTIMACIRSLTALGVSSNQYSIMLKSIVLKCLPKEFQMDFHRFQYDRQNDSTNAESDDNVDVTASNDNNSSESSVLDNDHRINLLLKFLKREINTLEALSETKNQQRSQSGKLQVGTATGLLTTGVRNGCIFCNCINHSSFNCDSALSLEQKKEILKRTNRCFRCIRIGHNSKQCRNRQLCCNKCKGRHVAIMCDPEYKKAMQLKFNASVSENRDKNSSQSTANLCMLTEQRISDVYLQTARAILSAQNGSKNVYVRAVLDGGSQLTFIKESVAKQLKLPNIGMSKLSVIPFGCTQIDPIKMCGRVRVAICGQYNSRTIVIEAIVVPEICIDILPTPRSDNPVFEKFDLADSCKLNLPLEEGISLLIGADNYWRIASGEIERISESLTAVKTFLGWTIQGPTSSAFSMTTSGLISAKFATLFTIAFEDKVNDLWDLEAIGIKPEQKATEEFSEDYAKRYLVKDGDRYIAALPWRGLKSNLNNNERGAIVRVKSLIRRLAREPLKLREYDSIMWDLIKNGIAEIAPADYRDNNERCYYMPHRPVYRDDKATTKVRIVFDASAHADKELSLNDHLSAGANLLSDVVKILLNFRMGIIGIVADIEKAFHQIMLLPEDRDSHSFYWFSSPLNDNNYPPMCAFRMTRVTFGVTSSPFILCATIKKHLSSESVIYPKTCQTLFESFYMDDLICSVNTEEEALSMYCESRKIMQKASMHLRKWNSNSSKLCSQFCDNLDHPDLQKVLGINWHVRTDELSVDITAMEQFLQFNPPGTKRNVLSTLSRIFDPFGFLCPFTITLKLLFQDCWRRKLEWDGELPDDLLTQWRKIVSDLPYLREMSLPRCAVVDKSRDIQLHIFTDASTSAYGAIAFMRIVDEENCIRINFICARGRLAPLKRNNEEQITLPRLELTAALVGARLYDFLRKSLKIKINNYYLWTDSKITLYWIKGFNKRWKPFIENRVHEIRGLTEINAWSHCNGCQNPADLLTRATTAKSLFQSTKWIGGPSWLAGDQNTWPLEDIVSATINLVNLSLSEKINLTISCSDPLIYVERFSSWNRLLRVTAYVIRFCRRLHEKIIPSKNFLISQEIAIAEMYWIKQAQMEEYINEINALVNKSSIPGTSSIYTLQPLLDENNILRVSGRLQSLSATYDLIHPVILPKKAYISKLIVIDCHLRTMHGGINTVLALIRQRFWICKGRQLIKHVIGKCIPCKRLRAQAATQPFAPLPPDRMKQIRPFDITGIDFAGPLCVKHLEDDSTKVYVLLATCASTRAVHLELCTAMTTESCILALRRFIARRGSPSTIYSDNAKTFKRCAKEFDFYGKFLNNDAFYTFLCSERICWKFIVERAPWWGGFWERIVRILKDILKVTIGRALLNFEQLQTLLAEAEKVINCRPLTYISDDSKDCVALTPFNFLVGSSTTNRDVIAKDISSMNSNEIKFLWTNRLKCLQYFWKRWKVEYLMQLRSLHHGVSQFSSNLKTGDIVLLEDPATSRLLWNLARIEEIYPGRDGKVRSCLLRLPKGKMFRRPVQLLYPLELNV